MTSHMTRGSEAREAKGKEVKAQLEKDPVYAKQVRPV